MPEAAKVPGNTPCQPVRFLHMDERAAVWQSLAGLEAQPPRPGAQEEGKSVTIRPESGLRW